MADLVALVDFMTSVVFSSVSGPKLANKHSAGLISTNS